MSGPWMQSLQGYRQDILDPEWIIDSFGMVVGLCRLVRFGGQTMFPVSIAQHSVLVARLCPAGAAPYGLLHDAHEVIASDLSTPMKAALGPEFAARYRKVTESIDRAVWRSFALAEPGEAIRAAVKQADAVALMIERRDAMRHPPEPWAAELEALVLPEHTGIRPITAEQAFSDFVAEMRRQLDPEFADTVESAARSYGLLSPRVRLVL